MHRLPILALVLLPVAFAAPASAAPESAVDVVKVEGAIDRPVADYLIGTLEEAERDGATVILQVDSPGALDEDGLGLAERVFESEVPVVVWVGQAPARAAGAGLLLMYASSLSAVSPGVGVGPLDPIDLAGGDEDAGRVRDLARGWREARGLGPGPPSFPDRVIPAQAALDGGIAQLRADSLPDLLTKLDGRTVSSASGETVLATENTEERPVTVRFHDLGPGRRVLHAVAAPTAIYLLLVLGLAALAFEFTQPGFGFAGFSGAGMCGLAIYGLFVVPVFWPGLVLLVVGIAAMAADVGLRRLGALTWGGLAAFAAGSVLAFKEASDAIDISPWLIGGAIVASLLFYGFGLTVAVQSRERLVSTRRGLVGLVGEARGDLAPEGPVFVKGALWRGRSADGPIAPGTRVRVREVDGLVLRVEPEPPESPPAGE